MKTTHKVTAMLALAAALTSVAQAQVIQGTNVVATNAELVKHTAGGLFELGTDWNILNVAETVSEREIELGKISSESSYETVKRLQEVLRELLKRAEEDELKERMPCDQ
jgi:hypothetical protein